MSTISKKLGVGVAAVAVAAGVSLTPVAASAAPALAPLAPVQIRDVPEWGPFEWFKNFDIIKAANPGIETQNLSGGIGGIGGIHEVLISKFLKILAFIHLFKGYCGVV